MKTILRALILVGFALGLGTVYGQSTYLVTEQLDTTEPVDYPANTTNDGDEDNFTAIVQIGNPPVPNANWHGPYTIPFAFEFFGTAVTEFWVSDNMLLTFDNPATGPTSSPNTSLPSGLLPDNTIAALWSCPAASISTINDGIFYGTFGTAPNRHLVVLYHSWTYGCTQNSYNYNKIILEEGTNKVYVVDAWSFSGAEGTTIGVQKDNTTAVEYSSNYDSGASGNASSSVFNDNDLFVFTPYTPLPNDAEALGIISPEDGGCGDSTSFVLGQVHNKGLDTIASIPVDVNITGAITASASTTTGSIAPGDTVDVTVGPFNLYDGGTINFELDIPWMSDDDMSNNTFTETLNLRDDRPAPIPQFDNDTTVCAPANLVLQVPPDPNPDVEYRWFDDLAAMTPAGTGTAFAPQTLTQSDTFYVSKIIDQQFTGNAGVLPTGTDFFGFPGDGNTFDVNQACTLDSVLVYPTNTGQASITIRNASGAVIASASKTVTSAGPTYVPVNVNLAPGTDYEIDRTGSSVLYEYSTNDSYFPFNVGSVITVTGEISGFDWLYIFEWKASNVTCPTAARPFYVEVQPSPDVDLGPDTVICNPTVLNVFDPNATSYVWSDGSTDPAKSVSTTQEDLSVTVSTSNGCSASDTVTIIAPGNPVFTPDDSLTVCGFWQPDPSNVDPTQQYTWSSGDTVPNPILTSTGTYSVDVINGCGITYTDSFYVEVLPGPVVDLGSKDTSVCNSNVIQLSTNLQGAPTYLHTWTASNGSNPGSGPNVTAASPNANTPNTDTVQYKVSVGQPGGCTVEDSITVYYLATPEVDLGPSNQSACSGITLDAGTFGQGLSYQWSTGATTQTIDLLQSGSYSVTVSSSEGCAATDTMLFNKVDSFTVDLGGDQTVCNSITQLNTELPPADYDFEWNTGETDSAIFVGNTGDYSVIVTDVSNGCQVYEEVQIVIQTSPEINLGPDQAICNPPFTLNTGLTQGSVLWSTGDTVHSVSVNSGGIYTVEVQLACGYEAKDTIVLNDIIPPTFDIEPAQTSSCDPIDLSTGLGPNYSHNWNTGQTTSDITVSESGTYIVEVRDVDGCAFSDTTQLVVNATPNIDLILPDSIPVDEDFVVDYDLTPYGLSINWNFGADALPFPTSTGPGPKVVNYPTVGTKTIEVTVANGPCVDNASGDVVVYIPSEDTVPVSRPDGVDFDRAQSLTFFPNPTTQSSAVTVVYNGPLREDLNLDMYDIIGQFIESYELESVENGQPITIQLPEDLSSGVYMIRVNDPNIKTQRLIIE